MSSLPPTELPERPGRPTAGPLGSSLVLACLLSISACANPKPPSPTASPPEPTPIETGATRSGDIDGLIVLTGGGLSVGTKAGVLVGIDGPGGQVSGFTAANGRLIVQTAGPAFAIADVEEAGATPAWRPVEMATSEVGHWLSAPVLSPRGDLVAFAAEDPGTTGSFEIVVIDLGDGSRKAQSFDRESNGPPVWIDDTSVLVEVLPIPGQAPFLRLDLFPLDVHPVRAEGFGPAISGDGSVLAVASTDGSVIATPASDWLAGNPPQEGALVDDSGHPFGLAVDRTGSRIAIGYADDAGDPKSIAVFLREGGGWRRSATAVRVAPGTRTVLGWLD